MPINLKFLVAPLLPIALAAMYNTAFASQDEEKLAQILQAKTPELKIESISRSPIDGLYEIVASSRVFYSDPTGAHVIIGDIIDTASQKNLTEARFKRINSTTINDLPFKYAIKQTNGNGKNLIATFFDPNCSFCKKMSPELDKIPNATIYIFLYPILSTDSAIKSETIFCANNPSLAWKQWVKEGKITAPRMPCQPTITKELISLGKKLNIKGTPTTFLPSGERVEGFISGKDLIDMIYRK